MKKNKGKVSLRKTLLAMVLSFLLAFSPVITAAAPLIAEISPQGGGALLYGKSSSYFGSLLGGAKNGDYDFEKEWAVMAESGLFDDVSQSFGNLVEGTVGGGELAEAFNEAVYRVAGTPDEDITLIDQLLVNVLRDENLRSSLGNMVGDILMDNGDEIWPLVEKLIGDALIVLQHGDFRIFLDNFLTYLLVEDGVDGVRDLLDELIIELVNALNTHIDNFLDLLNIDFSEWGIIEAITDPLTEKFRIIMLDDVADPDYDPAFEPLRDNLNEILYGDELDPAKGGIMGAVLDDFILEVLTDETLERAIESLIEIFLDPLKDNVLEPITDLFKAPADGGDPLFGSLVSIFTSLFTDALPCRQTDELEPDFCQECADGDYDLCTFAPVSPSAADLFVMLDNLMDYLNEEDVEGEPVGALAVLMGQVDLLLEAFLGSAIDIGGGGGEADMWPGVPAPDCLVPGGCDPNEPVFTDLCLNCQTAVNDYIETEDPLMALLGLDPLIDQVLGFVMEGDNNLIYHVTEMFKDGEIGLGDCGVCGYCDESNPLLEECDDPGLLKAALKPYLDDEEGKAYIGDIMTMVSAAVGFALGELLDNSLSVLPSNAAFDELDPQFNNDFFRVLFDNVLVSYVEDEDVIDDSEFVIDIMGHPAMILLLGDPDDDDNNGIIADNIEVAMDEDTGYLREAIDAALGEGVGGFADILGIVGDNVGIFVDVLLRNIVEEGEASATTGLIAFTSLAEFIDGDTISDILDGIFDSLAELDANEIVTDLKASFTNVVKDKADLAYDEDLHYGLADEYCEENCAPPFDACKCAEFIDGPYAYLMGYRLISDLLDSIADGIENPEWCDVPASDCSIDLDPAILCDPTDPDFDNLCPECQAAHAACLLEKAADDAKKEARSDALADIITDLLSADNGLLLRTLYTNLDGKYDVSATLGVSVDTRSPFACGECTDCEAEDPGTCDEPDYLETGHMAVLMGVIMEIIADDDNSLHDWGTKYGDPQGRIGALMEYIGEEVEAILEDPDVIAYAQSIASAGIGLLDRVFSPLLKLIYPRRYVHEYDAAEQKKTEMMIDEAFIANSLWRMGENLDGLLTEVVMVNEFPDAILHKFLNEFETVEDILSSGADNNLLQTFGTFMADNIINVDAVKDQKGLWYVDDMREMIDDLRDSVQGTFDSTTPAGLAQDINDMIEDIVEGFGLDEPIKLYGDPCGECDPCKALIAAVLPLTYEACERFDVDGDGVVRGVDCSVWLPFAEQCDWCTGGKPVACTNLSGEGEECTEYLVDESLWCPYCTLGGKCTNKPTGSGDHLDSLEDLLKDLQGLIEGLLEDFADYEMLVEITDALDKALHFTEACMITGCAFCDAEDYENCDSKIRTGYQALVDIIGTNEYNVGDAKWDLTGMPCRECAGCLARLDEDDPKPLTVDFCTDPKFLLVEAMDFAAYVLVDVGEVEHNGVDKLPLDHLIDDMVTDIFAAAGPVDVLLGSVHDILTDTGGDLGANRTEAALEKLILDLVFFTVGDTDDDRCGVCDGCVADPQELCEYDVDDGILPFVDVLLTDILSDYDMLDLVVYILQEAILEAVYSTDSAYEFETAMIEVLGTPLVPVTPEQFRTGIFEGLDAFFWLLLEWLADVDIMSEPDPYPFVFWYLHLVEVPAVTCTKPLGVDCDPSDDYQNWCHVCQAAALKEIPLTGALDPADPLSTGVGFPCGDCAACESGFNYPALDTPCTEPQGVYVPLSTFIGGFIQNFVTEGHITDWLAEPAVNFILNLTQHLFDPAKVAPAKPLYEILGDRVAESLTYNDGLADVTISSALGGFFSNEADTDGDLNLVRFVQDVLFSLIDDTTPGDEGLVFVLADKLSGNTNLVRACGLDCGFCAGIDPALDPVPEYCLDPQGLLPALIRAFNEIAPKGPAVDQFIIDHFADIITIIEAVEIDIEPERIIAMLQVNESFAAMIIDIVEGPKVGNIFNEINDFFTEYDGANPETAALTHAYDIGYMIADVPAVLISDFLGSEELMELFGAVPVGLDPGGIIYRNTVKDDYTIGGKLLDAIGSVVGNENTSSLVGELFSDGVHSLYGLFKSVFTSLGGFASGGSELAGSPVALQSDGSYDPEVLREVPSLGINALLGAGGASPVYRLQAITPSEDDFITEEQIDEIIEALLDWIKVMSADILYDERLQNILDEVIMDLVGEDGTKFTGHLDDFKNVAAGIIREVEGEGVIQDILIDFLGGPNLRANIDMLLDIVFEIMEHEQLIEMFVDVVGDIVEHGETVGFINDTFVPQLIEFVHGVAMDVLDDLFISNCGVCEYCDVDHPSYDPLLTECQDPQDTIINEVSAVVDSLVWMILENVPTVLADFLGDVDNRTDMTEIGEAITPVLIEAVLDTVVTVLGHDSLKPLLADVVMTFVDFVPNAVESAVSDSALSDLVIGALAEGVNFVTIGDALSGTIETLLGDADLRASVMPALDYISYEAPKRADINTPEDTWDGVPAMSLTLNIQKIVAGLLSGLPGNIINTVVFNWLIYSSGEPCGDALCDYCGDPLTVLDECPNPVGKHADVDPDKPVALGHLSEWVNDIMVAIESYEYGLDNDDLITAFGNAGAGFANEVIPDFFTNYWEPVYDGADWTTGVKCGICANCEDDVEPCQDPQEGLRQKLDNLLRNDLDFAAMATAVEGSGYIMNCNDPGAECDYPGCGGADAGVLACQNPIYIPDYFGEIIFGGVLFTDMLDKVSLIISNPDPLETDVVDILDDLWAAIAEEIPGIIENVVNILDTQAGEGFKNDLKNAYAALNLDFSTIADLVRDPRTETIIKGVLSQLTEFPVEHIVDMVQDNAGDIVNTLTSVVMNNLADFIEDPSISQALYEALFDENTGALYKDGSPGVTLLTMLAEWIEDGGLYDMLNDALMDGGHGASELQEASAGSRVNDNFFTSAIAGVVNWFVSLGSATETEVYLTDTGVTLQADADVVNIPDAKLKTAIEAALIFPGIEGEITKGDLRKIRGLTAANRGIKDLTGLENADNLEYLDLYGNEIHDLGPIMGLENIVSLNLAYNLLSDAEAAKLGGAFLSKDKLQVLDLSYNVAGDEEGPAEPEVKLSDIDFVNNLNMPLLLSFRATGNNVGALPASMPGLLEYLNVADNENLAGIGNLGALPLERLYMSNANRAAIPAGLSIGLTHLDLSDNAIGGGLNALAGMTEMRNLDLSGNSGTIDNINAVAADMGKLRSVSFAGTTMNYGAIAAALTGAGLFEAFTDGLLELNLSGTGLTGALLAAFPGLDELTRLRVLDISDNALNGDIDALAPLAAELRELNLADAGLDNTDLADIAALANLRKLNLAGNGITGGLLGADLVAFEALTKLEDLNLSGNPLNGIAGLENVTFRAPMQGIVLALNILPDMGFKAVEFMAAADGGGMLNLSGTGVNDISPLVVNPGRRLFKLDLSGNNIGNAEIGAILGDLLEIEFKSFMGKGIIDLSHNGFSRLGYADAPSPNPNVLTSPWIVYQNEATVGENWPYKPDPRLYGLGVIYLNNNGFGDIHGFDRTAWQRTRRVVGPDRGNDDHVAHSLVYYLEQHGVLVKSAPQGIGGYEVIEGEVIGSITNAAGAPVSGASVTAWVDPDGAVKIQEASKLYTAVTDEAGEFTLGIYEAGSYTVEVSKDGYLPYTLRPVDFEDNVVGLQTNNANVSLQMRGDVFNTGRVDVSSAIAIMRYVVGLNELDDAAKLRALVSGNAELGIQDAILVLRKVVGLIEAFPVK